MSWQAFIISAMDLPPQSEILRQIDRNRQAPWRLGAGVDQNLGPNRLSTFTSMRY